MSISEGSNTFDCVQYNDFSIPNCLLFDKEEMVNKYLEEWWSRIKNKISVHGLHQYNEGNGNENCKWENFYYFSKEENYYFKHFNNITESSGLHHETRKFYVDREKLKDINIYEYTDIYCSKDGIPFVITPYSLKIRNTLENKCQFLFIRISTNRPLRILNSNGYNLDQILELINFTASKGPLRNNLKD